MSQPGERDGEIRFSGLHITRSVPDRALLALLGTIGLGLFGVPLYVCLAYHAPNDWVIQAGRLFVEEVLLTMLLLSIACLIWGIAAPRWLERNFKRLLQRMVLLFVAMFFLLSLGFIFGVF
jgi:hypothetical protein